MTRVCKHCNCELTDINRAGPRLSCKPCRSKEVIKYQALDIERRRRKVREWKRRTGKIKQYPCEMCSTLCYRKQEKAFCSDKCRFTSHVAKTESCWLWTGCTNGRGYGLTNLKSENMAAHRVSYILYKGDIPEGLYVCHGCDNPTCVNPDHLWLGTTQDNKRDQIIKGRGGVKLDTEKVLLIRKMYAEKVGSLTISKIFEVTCGTISSIVKRRIWKHI